MHQLQSLFIKNPQAMSINLEYQNIRDLTLCMKKLKKFPNLKILSLHGNQIRILPLLSDLKIFTLDISHNPLVIDNYLLDSLFSAPSLQNLVIDVTEAEAQRILENLPNLKTLNKKKVVREKFNDKKNDITQRMKDSLRKQKQKLKQLSASILQKFQYHQKQTLSTFDTTFPQIFQQYRTFSDNVSIDTAKQGVFIYSKSRILDILQEKVSIALADNKMEFVADIFDEINNLRKQYFDSLLRIVLQVGYNQACLEGDLGDEIMTEMKNIKLRKQRLYLKEIMRLKKKNNDYRTYLMKIEQENKKYLHNLYSFAKGQSQKINMQPIKTPQNKPFDMFPAALKTQAAQTLKNAQNRSLTPSKSSQRLRDEQFTPRRSGNNKQGKQPQSKVMMNYEQTFELMEEMITEKHEYNQAMKKKKEAFQTAEEFLSIFFTNKYGGKNVAISWSLNFIKSLQIYAKENTICQVFLKILKNNIQQSFYQQHVSFIQQAKKHIKNQIGQVDAISQDQAQIIFLYFFPTQDLDQFKIIAMQNSLNQMNFQTLLKQLSKTHIKVHERMLAQFLQLFKQNDTNQDGALTLEQAKEFVTEFFKPKIEKAVVTAGIVDKVLKKLDPFKKNKIIFSELVDIVDKIR